MNWSKVLLFNVLSLLAGLAVRAADAPARVIQDFDADWRFSKGDFAAAMMPAFDDRQWRALDVPHDWSIEGPFSSEFGSGNGYAPGGVGWYRKHFRLDGPLTNRLVSVEFDGVYDHSEVWINGQLAGGRPYGFSSFALDLSPYVKGNGEENVLAVRVDHSRFADSRFYTGSGIYRHVRLVIAGQLHFAHWGVAVLSQEVSGHSATVKIYNTIENRRAAPRAYIVRSQILAPNGRVAAVATTTRPAAPDTRQTVVQSVSILLPELWSCASPALYTLKSDIICAGATVDETTSSFGIRSAVFDANHGFLLNGVPTKLKGVCLHHDAGSLGAAVPEPVLARRLRTLKEIGVNAIRTSHNPPDPALLDLCDHLGFLVMDEAFDEFTPGKNKWVEGLNAGVPSHYGYSELFDQWSVTDMADLVARDRNHPSVILWSIGNEIDYANDPFSDPVLGENYRPNHPPATDLIKCAMPLVAAVKSQDSTRPVTAALATVAMANAVGLPGLLDAAGYNYQEWRYASDHAAHPDRIIYGSENGQSYDAWQAVATNDYIAGQFLWTGADYLGEAREWPNRANGAGLLDLCGFKKPRAWFRQSLWSEKPMVYLCAADAASSDDRRRDVGAESWNWPANAAIRVICFANCPEVALTLNGQTIGEKRRGEAVNGVLTWDVPYAPGTLRAVGRVNGTNACEFELKTAGPPARIKLLPEPEASAANGQKISQIEYQIVDAAGVRVPDADDEVNFTVTGPAKILGIGNGDLANSEACQAPHHRAFQGQGLIILQSTSPAGKVSLHATAPGLAPAAVAIMKPSGR